MKFNFQEIRFDFKCLNVNCFKNIHIVPAMCGLIKPLIRFASTRSRLHCISPQALHGFSLDGSFEFFIRRQIVILIISILMPNLSNIQKTQVLVA